MNREPATTSQLMMMFMGSSNLYDRDFFCWTVETAALLRQGRVNEADLEDIAEEIESMGRRDRAGVESKVRLILAHLLKWQFQKARRGPSWIETITRERLELPGIFDPSPSLRR